MNNVKKKYLTVKNRYCIVVNVMEEKVRLGFLLDFYGELLNEHQRSVLRDYACDDFSLSEIADERGISRQGVHDLIKRCSKKLEGYEESLGLLERFLKIRDDAAEIKKALNIFMVDKDMAHITEIEMRADRIIDRL